MKRLLTLAWILAAVAGSCAWAQQQKPAASSGQPVLLDNVVAVINGDVLLQSDIDEEMRFAALEPFRVNTGKDTRQRALTRLINRSLILQQMKDQQQFNIDVSDAEVEKSLQELRSHLPQCAAYDCSTDAGWQKFLAANDLTSQEVRDHWKQRLAILRFIDLRFRTGIRISEASIAEYYAKSVVPNFAQHHQQAPPLDSLTQRIREVLLQEQVNGLLQDWLQSLHEEGSVQIVDPSYGLPTGSQKDEE